MIVKTDESFAAVLVSGPVNSAGRMARSNEISGGGEQAQTVVSCLGSAKSDVWTGFSQA